MRSKEEVEGGQGDGESVGGKEWKQSGNSEIGDTHSRTKRR